MMWQKRSGGLNAANAELLFYCWLQPLTSLQVSAEQQTDFKYLYYMGQRGKLGGQRAVGFF